MTAQQHRSSEVPRQSVYRHQDGLLQVGCQISCRAASLLMREGDQITSPHI